jgi:hypothetical protein
VIIYKLSGGLGNQLNEYAIAKYISKYSGHDIIFDTQLLTKDWQYVLYLDKLVAGLNFIEKINSIIKPIEEVNFEKDKFLKFDQNKNYIINKTTGSYFDYAKELVNLKYEVDFNGVVLNQGDKKALDEIENSESIAVHIRRGDYITMNSTKDKFGILDLQYYEKAMKTCKDIIDNPVFFIFSNDPAWVADNFSHLSNVRIVNHNLAPPNNYLDNFILYRFFRRIIKAYYGKRMLLALNDFFLMCKCKHFIIANSTYSWWAAYLGMDVNKIVICPLQWSKYRNSLQTVPQEWIKI